VGLGFELKGFEPHLQPIFALVYFGEGISQTICLSWLPTTVLPISASHIARMTGMSHQHPAPTFFFQYWGLNQGLAHAM
jgi:hypothetical protein